MSLKFLLSWFRSSRPQPLTTVRRRGTKSFKPEVEVLEDRVVPTSTFTVTTLSGTHVDGFVTLHEALDDLRTNGEAAPTVNTIRFDAGTGTITLPGALPGINKNVRILGGGAITVARDPGAGNPFSVFSVDRTGYARFEGLTIKGGASVNNGGGIKATNVNDLVIVNCTIQDCSAPSSGGGVSDIGGLAVVEINNSTFYNNSATAFFGGAVYVDSDAAIASLSVYNSSFNLNTAPSFSGGAIYTTTRTTTIVGSGFLVNIAGSSGGAINDQPMNAVNPTLNISRSFFSLNVAGQNGGAVANRSGATGRVRDTTFVANAASGNGGAIYDPNNDLIKVNDTETLNTAALGGGTYSDTGASGSGGTANCIYYGNTATNGGANVYGPVASLGHNLIGTTTGSTGWNANNGDILNTDPLLNALGYHGGTTQTMTLQYNSPALDAGDNNYAGTVDQRGYARIVNGTVDIGAVEMQSGEYSLSSPYAYNVDFSVQLGDTLTIDGSNSTPTLLDYSGNSGNSSVLISKVQGQQANVGYATATDQGGSIIVNGNGTVAYTPPANFSGDDSATYTTYYNGNSRTGNLVFHVTDVTTSNADFSTLKNQTLTSDANALLQFANAASGNTLTVTAINGSAGNVNASTTLDHGTLYVYSSGGFTFTPTAGFVGDQTFTVTAADNIQSSTFTATIHVVQVLAHDADYAIVHDHTLSVPNMYALTDLLGHASDADNGTLTVVAINGDSSAIGNAITTANGGTLTAYSNGHFSYTPPSLFTGTDWFSFTVSNGSVTSTASALIDVTNSAPTFSSSPSYSANANQTLNVPDMAHPNGLLSYASDADGDTLTVAAVNGDAESIGEEVATAHGTITVAADGSFVYKPTANWTGDDTFDITITDGIALVTATVTIHVS